MSEPRTIAFGELVPDLAPILAKNRCLVADNVLPVAGGYTEMPSLADLGEDALAKRPRGGLSVIDAAGVPFNIVGIEDKIYEIASQGLRDTSAASGYVLSDYERWDFAQFGDLVFASSFDAPLSYRDISNSLGIFAAVPEYSAGLGVPRARHLGVVKNHLVLGNVIDNTYGAVPDSVWWGAINAPLSYPQIGSDMAASLQSDRQPLRGNGGWVQAVVGGAEVGAIFQEKQIWRMDYRGGAEIFELNRIEPDLGLIVAGLAVPFSGGVFFLAEDGFSIFDYSRTVNIGKDKINQTFFADYDATYPERVWAISDPDSTRIWVIYPGTGNTLGRPNRAIVFDRVLGQWATGTFDLEMPVHAMSPGVNLDTLPDDDLDDTTLPDFDSRLSAPGARRLGGYGTDFKLGTFTGDGLIGTIETGAVEFSPGRRSCTIGATPLVTGNDHVSVSVAALKHLNSDIAYGRQSGKNGIGTCPLKKDGKYHHLRTVIGELGFVGFGTAVGLDVEFIRTGKK